MLVFWWAILSIRRQYLLEGVTFEVGAVAGNPKTNIRKHTMKYHDCC